MAAIVKERLLITFLGAREPCYRRTECSTFCAVFPAVCASQQYNRLLKSELSFRPVSKFAPAVGRVTLGSKPTKCNRLYRLSVRSHCELLEPVVTTLGSAQIGPMLALDGSAPDLQAVILAAGAFSATAASLIFGFRGDPVPCDKCGANGGTTCVFCEGGGKMKTEKGLVDCRVCKGAGMMLCRKCRGSGYSKRM